MSDEENKKAVARLLKELLAMPTEKEEDKIIVEINKLVLDPYWMDYIFHSNVFYDENEVLDVEGLLEKIFSYKPICL